MLPLVQNNPTPQGLLHHNSEPESKPNFVKLTFEEKISEVFQNNLKLNCTNHLKLCCTNPFQFYLAPASLFLPLLSNIEPQHWAWRRPEGLAAWIFAFVLFTI